MTATTVKCGGSDLALKTKAISNTKKTITLTANAQCNAGKAIEVTIGDADLGNNPAAGKVTVGLKSGSADEKAGLEYTTLAAGKVVWTSFAAAPDTKQSRVV